MKTTFARTLAAFACAASLSACVEPVTAVQAWSVDVAAGASVQHIKIVSAGLTTPENIAILQAELDQQVASCARGPNKYDMVVEIRRFRMADSGMVMLVGDANVIAGTVRMIDPTTQKQVAEYNVQEIRGGAGLLGLALLSGSVPRSSRDFAGAVCKRIFNAEGQAATTPATPPTTAAPANRPVEPEWSPSARPGVPATPVSAAVPTAAASPPAVTAVAKSEGEARALDEEKRLLAERTRALENERKLLEEEKRAAAERERQAASTPAPLVRSVAVQRVPLPPGTAGTWRGTYTCETGGLAHQPVALDVQLRVQGGTGKAVFATQGPQTHSLELKIDGATAAFTRVGETPSGRIVIGVLQGRVSGDSISFTGTEDTASSGTIGAGPLGYYHCTVSLTRGL
jgi:hypothetical protein